MATVLKNNDRFRINGDKKVTVSITFGADGKADDQDILLNAAEAITFYQRNGHHKAWTDRIEIKE